MTRVRHTKKERIGTITRVGAPFRTASLQMEDKCLKVDLTSSRWSVISVERIQDHQQLWLSNWRSLVILAEAMAILGTQKGIQITPDVILGSDSHVAINSITKHCHAVKLKRNLLEHTKNLATCIRNIYFIYCNMRADTFAVT